MDPITVMAVAQAGIQLYSMTRSGGGGIGSLLAAQTRMLAEISAQITVVNARLVEIYRGVEQLRDAVHALPREAALEAVKLSLGGLFIRAVEVMDTLAEYQRENGRAYAITRVQAEAERILDALRSQRSSLLGDGSVALCPVVATAWYVELQLATNCVPFDPVRITQAAQRYDKAFTAWLSGDIANVLQQNARASVAMRDGIARSSAFSAYSCHHSFEKTHIPRRSGGGKEGDHDSWIEARLKATRATLSAVPSPVRERLPLYREEFEVLRASGVQVDEAFGQIEPLQWTLASAPVSHVRDSMSQKTVELIDAIERDLRRTACPDDGFATKFVADENARAASAEKLFMQTVLYSHFQLACREAQNSVRSVLQRTAEPAFRALASVGV